MKRHGHDYHELIVVLRGSIWVKDDSYESFRSHGPGSVLFYPAQCYHTERSNCNEPVETIFFSFDGGDLDDDSIVSVYDSRGRIRTMANWLWEDKVAGVPSLDSRMTHGLGLILNEFLDLLENEGKNSLVSRLRQYMQTHIGDKLTLDVLASEAGLTKFHLIRKYKLETGSTPIEELRKLRLEKARELVEETLLPLKVIAMEVGFSDEYHLSHLFKKYWGRAPSELRKRRI